MRIIISGLFLIVFLIGALIGIKAYRLSKEIIIRGEKRIRKAILDSILSGLSISLIIFSGVNFLATITNESISVDILALLSSFLFFLIPGLLVFLGSLIQYFIFGLYRDRLNKYILERSDGKK